MKRNSYEKIVTYIVDNQEKFYRLAYSYTKNKDTALDMVQNAIVKTLEKHYSIKNPDYIKTWFFRVLVNECLGYIKKNKREIPSGGEIKEGEYREQAYEPGLELYRLVEELPVKVRTVIMLRYYEDMTLKEIADITNTNLNTVKSRLYAGLTKLKPLVKEEFYE